MVKLYRQEIRWMLNMVIKSRDNSEALKDHPGQIYAGLHNLEFENMAALAEKLEKVLQSDGKRIEVK